jgi:hypothetical protein
VNFSTRCFLRFGARFGLAALVLSVAAIVFGQQKNSTPLGSGIGPSIPKEARLNNLFKLSMAKFQESLRTTFTFQTPAFGPLELELIDVSDQRPAFARRAETSDRECFSLLFQGPPDKPLTQDTYAIEHKELGKFQLFIVPTRKQGNYIAIINRLLP